MLGHLLALEMAHVAVEESMRRGATYADARFEIHQREDVTVRNGQVRRALIRVDRGLGVRALVNGAWGFASVSNPTRHDASVIARRAADVARAAAVVQERVVELAFEPPHAGVFRTPIQRDPLAVPLETKLGLCFAIDEKARISPLVKLVETNIFAHRVRKLYVSSEGAELDQDLVQTGLGYHVGVSDGQDYQVRSYPDAHGGTVFGRGWEAIEGRPWAEKAGEVAAEAIALLTADPCPSGQTNLILATNQLALQIHESCGHPAELDRVLGTERNFAGASFLVPDRLGQFQYGSPLVTLYADAREQAGVGTFGYDDEGVEAQRVDLVSQGRFSGYLSSRESASRVGLKRSSGSMRASSYAQMPLVRMTNISLEPGDGGDLEALIADTKNGILMETNKSWSIDDLRYNFQFGCEAAWEIKDGKKGRLLKNPVYAGVTPQFWRSMDAVCDKSEWTLHGLADCGKGQPLQLMATGHGASPARFQDVVVGSKASELVVSSTSEAPSKIAHPEAAAIPKAAKKSGGAKKSRAKKKS